jgi:Lon protease-like protein
MKRKQSPAQLANLTNRFNTETARKAVEIKNENRAAEERLIELCREMSPEMQALRKAQRELAAAQARKEKLLRILAQREQRKAQKEK